MCGCCYGDNALRPSEGGKLSTRSNESADPIQVLYGSCNGESSGLSLWSIGCVSHELHARNILDEDEYNNNIFLTTCASLVCLQCCCSALDNSSEELMRPCCNGDHIHDIRTVVPPTAVVTKATAGLEVRCSECSCKVRMG